MGGAVIKTEPQESFVPGVAPLDNPEHNNVTMLISSNNFQSPPGHGRVFRGFKRHSQQTFAQGQSGKKKRTPNRSNAADNPSTMPLRTLLSADAFLQLSEEKCKRSETGDLFLKKKKTTASTSSALFKAIQERGKEVVVFESESQSFYRIMAYYSQHIDLVPENERHHALKEQLFDFIMENRKYTQVLATNVFCIKFILTSHQ